jgi:hypothetical protein
MFEQTFKNIDDILYKDAGSDSEEFIPWDYESKKCPQCEDGVIGESDEGVLIMVD